MLYIVSVIDNLGAAMNSRIKFPEHKLSDNYRDEGSQNYCVNHTPSPIKAGRDCSFRPASLVIEQLFMVILFDRKYLESLFLIFSLLSIPIIKARRISGFVGPLLSCGI